MPKVAPIPMQLANGLPEAGSVFAARSTEHGHLHTTIAIVAYPHMGHPNEFQPLMAVPGVRIVRARSTAELVDADWLILPGSQAAAADLQWMRSLGLDAAVVAHANAGKRVLGIGGGLPILGEALIDLHGVDGNAAGLGLLPLVTVFAPQKTARCVRVHLPALRGTWSALHGLDMVVHEVQHGQTELRVDLEAGLNARADMPVPGAVWQSALGNVWGTYWHGMFENTCVLQALWGAQGTLAR